MVALAMPHAEFQSTWHRVQRELNLALGSIGNLRLALWIGQIELIQCLLGNVEFLELRVHPY